MERQTMKDHIADNFEELLEAKSFESITVSEIARKSHISRTTFYRCFQDKFDLVTWIYKQEINQILTRYPQGYQWETIVLEFLQLTLRKKTFFRLTLTYYQQNSLFETIYECGYSYCKEIILKRLKAEKLPENLEYSVHMYTFSIAYIEKEWILNGMKEKPEKLAEYLCENMPVPMQPYFQE